MQTVCDQKFCGMFAGNTERNHEAHFEPLTMPAHEKRLGWRLFSGGLVLSALMIMASYAAGLL